jgi:ASC-1-like (ASCH) protein
MPSVSNQTLYIILVVIFVVLCVLLFVVYKHRYEGGRSDPVYAGGSRDDDDERFSNYLNGGADDGSDVSSESSASTECDCKGPCKCKCDECGEKKDDCTCKSGSGKSLRLSFSPELFKDYYSGDKKFEVRVNKTPLNTLKKGDIVVVSRSLPESERGLSPEELDKKYSKDCDGMRRFKVEVKSIQTFKSFDEAAKEVKGSKPDKANFEKYSKGEEKENGVILIELGKKL